MSQAPSSSQAAASGFSIARVMRLARKELRETLRDRRTIITLVVMPLLVYPVLGLALWQFLVSSTAQSEPLPLKIATETEQEYNQLKRLLDQGEALLEQKESVTTAPLAGGPILGADLGSSELPPSKNQISWVPDGVPFSLEDLVRDNQIDLGVRLLPTEGGGGGPTGRLYEFIYRSNMPLSRQAVSYVERRLRAVNDEDLRSRLEAAGDQRPHRARWRLHPIADEQGHSDWLGTLVPLVLILMTITGAVYPAIDLTAGERERGTLEALMAAPVPRLAVLLAKYLAVVTVATLTAVVNLTAMTITLAATGGGRLWAIFFGTQGTPAEAIVEVLILLVLFSGFFSAVLLLVTSFARSFKEAQAYVVPLMVVCLAPGFISVMPGLELNPLMSVVPLANIVLLTRDVLEGDAPFFYGAIAVLSTILYGGVAMALAARVFGSDAILYGSAGTTADLFRRPREFKPQAAIPDAVASLAIVAPVYVVVSGVLGGAGAVSMPAMLMAMAATSMLLFIALPLGIARLQGVRVQEGFQLHRPTLLGLAAAIVLGCTLWPLAYDLIILCQKLGIATLSIEKLAASRPELMANIERLREVPPWILLLAFAIAPAIGEEFFFRGYLLGSLRGKMAAWGAIALIGVVFGVFHTCVGGLIAVERVLSSTLLGLVLGWICWQTGSVIPGMLLHALHNGLMASLIYLGPQLKAWGLDTENETYLPPSLVAVTSAFAAIAIAVLWRSKRSETAFPSPISGQPAPVSSPPA